MTNYLEKNKGGKHILSDFQTYYQVVVVETKGFFCMCVLEVKTNGTKLIIQKSRLNLGNYG